MCYQKKAVNALIPMYNKHNKSVKTRPSPSRDPILIKNLRGKRNKILNNNHMKFGFISKMSLIKWFDEKDRSLLDKASSKKNKFVIKKYKIDEKHVITGSNGQVIFNKRAAKCLEILDIIKLEKII